MTTVPDTSGPSPTFGRQFIGDVAADLLRDRIGPRTERAVAALAVGHSVYALGRRAYNASRSRLAYRIAVASTDRLYPHLHAELLARVPDRRQRSLLIASERHTAGAKHSSGPDCVPDTPGVSRRYVARLVAFYDGAQDVTLPIGGHRVRVTIERDQALVVGADGGEHSFPTRSRIAFWAHGAAARDAVMAFLREVAESTIGGDDDPRLFIAGRWGGWDDRTDMEPRPLETVVLRSGRKEALVADLLQFRSMRDDYHRLGLPYHRGYLFEGPAGTGKTSLARALASHVGMDMYYIPLSDLAADTDLIRMVATVPSGAMLLLEDIDVLHGATHRDDAAGQRISLSGLLNTLDGVATPSGLVTVMTTNHVEVLDEALIRPGRADVVEHVGFMDDTQFAEVVRVFVGRTVPLPPLGGRTIAPTAVAEVVKRHMGDTDATIAAIRELVTDG